MRPGKRLDEWYLYPEIKGLLNSFHIKSFKVTCKTKIKWVNNGIPRSGGGSGSISVSLMGDRMVSFIYLSSISVCLSFCLSSIYLSIIFL